MIWLDTKEEVDFDWFMEVLKYNELQVVSREWSEEECEEVQPESVGQQATVLQAIWQCCWQEVLLCGQGLRHQRQYKNLDLDHHRHIKDSGHENKFCDDEKQQNYSRRNRKLGEEAVIRYTQ